MPNLKDLTDQLHHRLSAKRRSAAISLRKLGDIAAGPALLDALKEEIKDERTWETQYQMIMALGHSNYVDAFPLIQILAHEKFKATMVLVAIGDAYVRLKRRAEDDATPLREVLAIRNDEGLHDGALRAVAMLRMRFNQADTDAIIRDVTKRKSERLKFWLAAACPGWSGTSVDQFLDECALSTREDVRSAAEDAKRKKYRKWRPL